MLAAVFLLSGVVLAAEDLSTWTEVDPRSDITLTATDATWENMYSGTDIYAYNDLGSTENWSYTAEFTLSLDSGTGNGGLACHFGTSDGLGGLNTIKNAAAYYGLFVCSSQSASAPNQRVYIYEINPGDADNSAQITIVTNTVYYARFTYDRTAGTYGTAYLWVFTDASRTLLHGQVTEVLQAYSQYRYLMTAVNNNYSGYGSDPIYDHWGTMTNLEFDTLSDIPDITTGTPTYNNVYLPELGYWAATFNGTVTNDGGENTTVSMYWKVAAEEEWYWANATGYYTTGETAEITVNQFDSDILYDYFFRVTNSAGYDDGDTEQFTITGGIVAPMIDTLGYPITLDSENLTATIYGRVWYDGGANVTGYHYWRPSGGPSWNLTANTTDLITDDLFNVTITNLEIDQTYQYYAAGNNSVGGDTGAIAEFTLTVVGMPTVVTLAADNIENTSVDLAANLTDMSNDDAILAWFQFREVGNLDWQTTQVTYRYATGTYLIPLAGLTPATDYEFRAVAQAGILGGPQYTDYGDDILIFTTMADYQIPVLTTGNVTYISPGVVMIRSSVYYDGGTPVEIWVQYRPDNAIGWTDSIHSYGAVTDDGIDSWISGLVVNQVYEYQTKGENETGPGEGSIRRFYITNDAVTNPDDASTPGTGNAITDWADNLLEPYGLDNVMGHWAITAAALLLIALGFLIGMAITPEHTAKKIISIVWLLVSLCIMGAALFSGFLGLFAVIILVFIAAGLILILGGRLLSRGNLASG